MARATLLLMAAVLTVAPRGAVAQGNLTTAIAPSTVVFPTPGVADFMAGYVDAPPVTVDITSRPKRLSWELQIRADAPDLGGYGKPLSDILWRPDGGAAWEPLSTLDRVVTSGSGDAVLLVHFRLRLDWAYDEPGSYGVSFTFTTLRP